ncbi:MAG: hypothetical protein ABI851_12865 [Saprospiraceae bacterium]
MPINISKKLHLEYSLKPFLAQFLGPVFSENISSDKKIEALKFILTFLSQKLKLFDHCFHPNLTDIVKNSNENEIDLESFRTYELNLKKTESEIFFNFSSSIKNHVKKAERIGLTCITSSLPLELVRLSLRNKIITIKQAKIFEKMWNYIQSTKQGFILYVQNKDGLIYSGGAFVINNDKVSFVLSASNKELKSSGGNSLLIWEAIKKCKAMAGIRTFDFEGSMLHNVETYFKHFRPDKIEYMHIKINRLSKLYNYVYAIKKIFRSI